MEVTLITSDGKEITVPRKIEKMSLLINNACEDQDEIDPILISVKSERLQSIIEYCAHYDFNKTESTIP